MAEITQSGSPKPGGQRRQFKKPIKVDFTAMVDVAFLLLTFFVMTTQMKKETVMMAITLPDAGENHSKISQEKFLTLIPAENDRLFYYLGTGEQGLKPLDYGTESLGKMIQSHLNHKGTLRCVGEETGNGCWDPIVVVKPRKRARYKNLVDVLDEMKISGVSKYAIAPFTEADSSLWRASNSETEGQTE